MKINVKNHNVIVEGEKVKEIEFLYTDLLRKGPIKQNKPEKSRLIIYHLENGGKWEFLTEIILTEDDLK